jgi:hypothetical protein
VLSDAIAAPALGTSFQWIRLVCVVLERLTTSPIVVSAKSS